MIKKGINVTIIFVVSTFIQLLSQIVVTKLFGASQTLEEFLAAVALPTIIVTIIYGTINDALLPIYAEKRHTDSTKADQYLFSIFVTIAVFSIATTVLLAILSYPVSLLLYGAKGFQFNVVVSRLMAYLYLCIPLSVTATIFGTYHYAHKHFLRFPLAQAVGSVVNLLIIVGLHNSLGIWSLVIAFVVNILFQIFFVLPNGIKGFKFVRINLKPFLYAWIPLIIGTFALRSDTLLIRSFGSSLQTGFLVYLNLISKIFSMATSVMTIGIQVVLLPHLIERINQRNHRLAIKSVNNAKLVSIGVSVGVTLIVVVVGPILINLLFVGGKFTQQDANVANSLLPYFILPAIGWGINSVFFQPLIALKKQLPLSILHLVSFTLAWIFGTVIKSHFGALQGIVGGLIILLFTGIIGSEILWQYYKNTLLKTSQS